MAHEQVELGQELHVGVPIIDPLQDPDLHVLLPSHRTPLEQVLPQYVQLWQGLYVAHEQLLFTQELYAEHPQPQLWQV